MEEPRKKGENMKGPKTELRFDGDFYDITTWTKRHPGGRVIEFYTEKGEDASVAIREFHHRSMPKVMSVLRSLKSRPAQDTEEDNVKQDLSLLPTMTSRHDVLSEDFIRLHNELDKEGYFRPSVRHVCYRLLELVFLAATGLYLVQSGGNSIGWKALGIFSFALFQGRAGWLMHEAGHCSLTGNTKVDRILLVVIMGFGIGLSGSLWRRQHSRHHAMPQRLGRDGDLETMPLLAFHAKVVRKDRSLGNSFFIRHQAALYLAVDTFLALSLWKIYFHPMAVLRTGHYHELPVMLLHYVAFVYPMGGIPYLLSVWLMSIYMLGNFALSHSHLPLAEGPLHWVEYAFLHTVDVQPSWWCDWWMGYLNYQVLHHLFPCMPQFRHPQIRERVKEFAANHGLPYRCMSYAEAMKRSLQNLADVSSQLAA